MRRNPQPQIPTRIHTPTVIDPARPIPSTGAVQPAFGSAPRLHKPHLWSTHRIRRARGAFAYHLLDRGIGARIHGSGILVARRRAVVVLHEPWVADTVVGGGYADAAGGLLEDDCEDEAGVEVRFDPDEEGGVVNGLYFEGRVEGDMIDGAGIFDQVDVVGEPIE